MTQTELITSIKDPRIVQARELHSASGRARLHRCLLEGGESIQWAIEADLPIEYIFYQAGHEQDPLYTALRTRAIPCYGVSQGILKKISDTSYLVPYVGVARIPESGLDGGVSGDFVVVLDGVQDHGNIGTIIRTASAFGIREIVSTAPNLDLYYKKIVDASRGRVFSAHLTRYPDGVAAVSALQQRGYQVVATSSHARDIQALAPLQARPIALVVGNESEGVSPEILCRADIVVQIPMSGQVESLNVGVATGISLYEIRFRMVLSMLVSYIRANIGRQVNVTGQLIRRAFDAHIRQHSDLTGEQAILLMILVIDQTMTLDQVSRDTGAIGAEREALLQPLIEKGYIRYQAEDQAAIVPTEAAGRTLAQLWSVIERAEQAVLSGFTETEKGQFVDFLQRIQGNCERIVFTPPAEASGLRPSQSY